MRKTPSHRAGRALLAVALLLPFTGCAGEGPRSVKGKHTLRVGVKYDQPGIGMRRPDGTFEGFDVEVARYVATKLGAKDVEFVGLTSGQREDYLLHRKVDLVIATYSITAKRKTIVTYAGPYYVAHQDIMVRADDTSVSGLRDLKDKRLCQSQGSNSVLRVTEEHGIPATLVPAASYGECFTKLTAGQVDAVTTDDLILAGFALQQPKAVRLVNTKFTDEKWGIGLHRSDVRGCEEVNRAVTGMYQDGTAERLLKRWFGPTGVEVTTTVPQFEGCS
ncbi:glutamate ABC transporter substrate-binding protein [Actinocorallia longicatena]|uniref:Glutamate ABC transporter substrate-binding protein n=1 Tax=Actinocorallia longicatena TaxID=111803 RepID=A0ABP6PZZ3_9ACTN